MLIKAHHPCAGQSWALSWGPGAGLKAGTEGQLLQRPVGFECGSNEESLMKCRN